MEKYDISKLLDRINTLETENDLLKKRLEEAGIPYQDIIGSNQPALKTLTEESLEYIDSSESYDPDQGARILPFEATDKVANTFFMMFCRGRKDVYDLRYTNPKTGKNGYYTQCKNRWDRDCHIQKRDGIRCRDCEIQAYKELTLQTIKAHMEGKNPYGNDVVAIYPMLDNNVCQLIVFDFDNHAEKSEQMDYANTDEAWKEEVNALRQICRSLGIDAVVERSRSGKGAHLWIFFKEMIPARLARKFGFALLEKGAESVNLKSFRYYDRMIPAQDALPKGGLGKGLKVSIVTWHPGVYAYGRDDARMALLERLRKAGFEIRLVEESCERYTIIDREIVWYGSVNYLAKEDIDDNLMRVCSREIAAELLEMTFGSDIELENQQAYTILNPKGTSVALAANEVP